MQSTRRRASKRTAPNSKLRQPTATGKATAHPTVSVRELMLTDRSRCLLWVNNGHLGQLKECPLYPQKQTFQDGHDVRFVPKADIQLTVTSKIKPRTLPGVSSSERMVSH